MCLGCKDDFYNSKNTIGVDECWHFKDAEIVKVIRIGFWENPPYADKPIEKKLSCYRRNREVFYKVPEQATRKKRFTLIHWRFHA